jgi:hypothetical protein
VPEIPHKLMLFLEDLRRANNARDQRAFNEALIKALAELEKVWPILHADIKNAE